MILTALAAAVVSIFYADQIEQHRAAEAAADLDWNSGRMCWEWRGDRWRRRTPSAGREGRHLHGHGAYEERLSAYTSAHPMPQQPSAGSFEKPAVMLALLGDHMLRASVRAESGDGRTIIFEGCTFTVSWPNAEPVGITDHFGPIGNPFSVVWREDGRVLLGIWGTKGVRRMFILVPGGVLQEHDVHQSR